MPESGMPKSGMPGATAAERRAAVIVTSTRAAAGVYLDRTGPVIRAWLAERGFVVGDPVVVADGDAVPLVLAAELATAPDVLVTTGGTGVAPGDGTADAVRRVLDVELPGIGEELRRRGSATTPRALLSREVAGLAGRTVVLTLPGSPGGVADGLALFGEVLDHLLEQRDGHGHV